jgi:hypothetical protein
MFKFETVHIRNRLNSKFYLNQKTIQNSKFVPFKYVQFEICSNLNLFHLKYVPFKICSKFEFCLEFEILFHLKSVQIENCLKSVFCLK